MEADAALSLSLLILQASIKAEPAIAAEIRSLFAKGDPTDADWQALRARYSGRVYKNLVPHSNLPE